MSLNWSAENTPQYKRHGTTTPVTDALVFMTLAIGINEITDSNARIFFHRVDMLEKLFGAQLMSQDGETCITWLQVQDHRGLRTNASTLTDTQFLKRVWERQIREGNDLLNSKYPQGAMI